MGDQVGVKTGPTVVNDCNSYTKLRRKGERGSGFICIRPTFSSADQSFVPGNSDVICKMKGYFLHESTSVYCHPRISLVSTRGVEPCVKSTVAALESQSAFLR